MVTEHETGSGSRRTKFLRHFAWTCAIAPITIVTIAFMGQRDLTGTWTCAGTRKETLDIRRSGQEYEVVDRNGTQVRGEPKETTKGVLMLNSGVKSFAFGKFRCTTRAETLDCTPYYLRNTRLCHILHGWHLL